MQILDVCFGFSNVLADINDEYGIFKIRPGAMELLSEIHNRGHKITLWTTKKRGFISLLEQTEKHFFKQFDKIYCMGDVEVFEDIPGNSVHHFKNINKIGVGCLIDSKPAYKKYAECLNIGDKYFILDKYRDCLYKQPTSWQIRVVDEDALEKYHKRLKEQENWVYDVLHFIEKLETNAISI